MKLVTSTADQGDSSGMETLWELTGPGLHGDSRLTSGAKPPDSGPAGLQKRTTATNTDTAEHPDRLRPWAPVWKTINTYLTTPPSAPAVNQQGLFLTLSGKTKPRDSNERRKRVLAAASRSGLCLREQTITRSSRVCWGAGAAPSPRPRPRQTTVTLLLPPQPQQRDVAMPEARTTRQFPQRYGEIQA